MKGLRSFTHHQSSIVQGTALWILACFSAEFHKKQIIWHAGWRQPPAGLVWFDWGTGIGMPCNLVISTHLHLLSLIIIRCQPAVENITVHRWSRSRLAAGPAGPPWRFSMTSGIFSRCYSIFKSWEFLGQWVNNYSPACCRWHIDSAHRAAVCDQLPISEQRHSPQGSQSSGTSKLKILPKPRASLWTQQLNSLQLSHSMSWLLANAIKTYKNVNGVIAHHWIASISGILIVSHRISPFYFKEQGACRSSLSACLSVGLGVTSTFRLPF